MSEGTRQLVKYIRGVFEFLDACECDYCTGIWPSGSCRASEVAGLMEKDLENFERICEARPEEEKDPFIQGVLKDLEASVSKKGRPHSLPECHCAHCKVWDERQAAGADRLLTDEELSKLQDKMNLLLEEGERRFEKAIENRIWSSIEEVEHDGP